MDDRNAVYPVTVDPLNKTSEWTTSADGILPALLTNLQLQVQTLYGYNTAGVLLEMRKINLREHQQIEVMNRNRSMISGVYIVTLHDENNNKTGTVRLIFNAQ